ncbi:MAG: glycerophosphodiester phosphodiesterase family protein [Thermodesulfobacteriota bacterium]
MLIIGHRGAAGLAPENTLSSFQKACDLGVDAVELDVLLSSDGEVVVYHDYTLKPEITRTPDGKWLDETVPRTVYKLTLSELKAFDIGRVNPLSPYSKHYPRQHPADGEQIPTLREVIQLICNQPYLKAELWIEIKTSPEKPDLTPSPEKVVEAVYRILDQEKALSKARLLSFDWRGLLYCRNRHPEIPLIFLSHNSVTLGTISSSRPALFSGRSGIDRYGVCGSIPQAIHHSGGTAWGPHFSSMTSQDIAEAHRLGIKVYVWSPDDPSDMECLLGMNVDGIITNRPDILKNILESSF